MTATVVELRPSYDVAKTLRVVADEIERGEHGSVKFIAAVMIHDGAAALFCWGEASDLEVCGALSIGHHRALADDGPR